MRKIFITLCLFVFSSINVYSDTPSSKIYLKNGSIIIGEIVEYNPGKTIKILTPGDEAMMINDSNVVKIEKNIIDNQAIANSGSNTSTEIIAKKRKWFLEMDFGIYDEGFLCLTTGAIFGGQLNPYFFIGGGLSFGLADGFFIPTFACIKVNATKRKVAPTFDFRLGLDNFQYIYTSQNLGLNIKAKHVEIIPTVGIETHDETAVINTRFSVGF